jgi:putative PIN family toxin of toxin-antitoxin system
VRVVFDTNIFISALAIRGSLAEKAIIKIIEGGDILLISKDIINEVLSVLSSKFSRDKEGLSHVAVILSELGELVKPTRKVSVFKHDPDNRILECALHGKADVLVTGDKEMLRLTEYEQIRIMSLKEYVGS